MKEKITIVELLIEKVEQYVKTTLELYKLKAVEKASSIIAVIITSIVLSVVILLCTLILSIGAAIYLGEVFGRLHLGFVAIGGIYALIGIVLVIFKKKLLQNIFMNLVINSIFKEEEKDASN